MRAGGVPGRLVDAVDVRDFCAFATLPADAARRAFEFARRDPALPAIRPAAPAGEKR
jgi:ATP-dependent RNA helicase DeaD